MPFPHFVFRSVFGCLDLPSSFMSSRPSLNLLCHSNTANFFVVTSPYPHVSSPSHRSIRNIQMERKTRWNVTPSLFLVFNQNFHISNSPVKIFLIGSLSKLSSSGITHELSHISNPTSCHASTTFSNVLWIGDRPNDISPFMSSHSSLNLSYCSNIVTSPYTALRISKDPLLIELLPNLKQNSCPAYVWPNEKTGVCNWHYSLIS